MCVCVCVFVCVCVCVCVCVRVRAGAFESLLCNSTVPKGKFSFDTSIMNNKVLL